MKRCHGSRGFSIVEGVLVIILLAILSFAVTAGFDVDGANIDIATRRLQSDLQFAQDLAVTRGSNIGFRSISVTSYEIFEGQPGSPASDPLTRGPYIIDMRDIAPGVSFPTLPPQILFDRSGTPLFLMGNRIVLTNGQEQRVLEVTQNTGVVLRR